MSNWSTRTCLPPVGASQGRTATVTPGKEIRTSFGVRQTPEHPIEERLEYWADGSIRSDDECFDRQLDDVLNLNIPLLKRNRASVLTSILEWWRLRKAKLRGPVPRAELERKRDGRIDGDQPLEPFCQVGVWWLQKKLRRPA